MICSEYMHNACLWSNDEHLAVCQTWFYTKSIQSTKNVLLSLWHWNCCSKIAAYDVGTIIKMYAHRKIMQ